jgi:hypothetical protein
VVRQNVWWAIVLTIYGVTVLTLMMVMYALERRDPRFILAFAVGCALSSSYGFASGAWPFGVVESIWCLIALHRFYRRPPARATEP